MGIFENGSAFLGGTDRPMPMDVMELCGKIRTKLGSQASLLDRYLFLIARRLCAVDQPAAVRKGTQDFESLAVLCRNLAAGGVPMQPFSHKAIEYMVLHPLDIEDAVVRGEIYALHLAGEYYHAILPDASAYFEKAGDKFGDVSQLKNLYGELADLCETQTMDKLDDALRAAWQPVSPLALWSQGYIFAMLDVLVTPGEADSKNNLSLLLDALANHTGAETKEP